MITTETTSEMGYNNTEELNMMIDDQIAMERELEIGLPSYITGPSFEEYEHTGEGVVSDTITAEVDGDADTIRVDPGTETDEDNNFNRFVAFTALDAIQQPQFAGDDEQKEIGDETNLTAFYMNNRGTMEFSARHGFGDLLFTAYEPCREGTDITDADLTRRGADGYYRRQLCYAYTRDDIAAFVRAQAFVYQRLRDNSRVRLYWLGSVHATLKKMLNKTRLMVDGITPDVESMAYWYPRFYFAHCIVMNKNELSLFLAPTPSRIPAARRDGFSIFNCPDQMATWMLNHKSFAEGNQDILHLDVTGVVAAGGVSTDTDVAISGGGYVHVEGAYGIYTKEYGRCKLKRGKKLRGRRKYDVCSLMGARYLMTTGNVHDFIMEQDHTTFEIGPYEILHN